jgi:hypothetical protein
VEDYGLLAETFKRLADNLVDDYDVIELSQQLVDSSVALLPVTSVGLLICDSQGDLHVLASSSEEARLLETLQLAADLGPCLLAYRSGQQVVVEDLGIDSERWPAFAERAAEYNYHSVCALPLRLRDEHVGALNLFREEFGSLSPADIAVGQALADMAAIGILHQRVVTRSEMITQQLQTALNTRVVIEQAKGVLAERGAVGMETAFTLMRSHARRTHQKLADLARGVVENTADTDAILKPDTLGV